MYYAQIFALLLVFILGLGRLAQALKIPYPILFVLGGLGLGYGLAFFPHLPRFALDPNCIFFVFLPPLLYIQAYNTSWRDFRFYLRSITLLSIGLVLASTLAVAYTAHWLIPDFPLSAGFVLGAIISPPDAIAASAIAQRLGLSRRVLTVLEGESLVNDATSLVIFKIALAAVLATGPTLSPIWYPVEFIYVSVGGIAVGLAVGGLAGTVRRRSLRDDAQLLLTTSLLIPFISYFAADLLQVSGVLAVVTTGLYLGWRAPEDTTFRSRLQARALWDMIVYLLNGMIFILIGLQLPGILDSMHEPWWPRPFAYAVAINLVCIVVRIAWVFPGAYLPRWLSSHIRRTEKKPDWREVTVVSWCGMRGVVSLAAALVLNGTPNFPRNHLVQFLAFSVILTTLVFQGLTLPILIRVLGLTDDGVSDEEERSARAHISGVVMAEIDRTKGSETFPASALERIEQFYRERAWHRHDPNENLEDHEAKHRHAHGLRQLHLAMIAVQRRELLGLRQRRLIGDDILHKIEHELDLEETQLHP